jgi:anti-anti-sigma regulatory factor
MRSTITRTGNQVIIHIEGLVDYETQDSLKDSLAKILEERRPTHKIPGLSTDQPPAFQVVFDFSNLEFVGSMGISNLIQILRDFGNRSGMPTRICRAKIEFQKLIRAYDEEAIFEFYDSEEAARRAPVRSIMDH